MQPNPALGIPAGFDSSQVRNALLFAMQMGTPNKETERVRFVKKSPGRRYFLDDVEKFPPPLGDLRLDRDLKPLNPNIVVQVDDDVPIPLDVSIEITQVNAEELPVGSFRPVKAEVTMMQQEYDQMVAEQAGKEMLYNNDRYGYAYETEAIGLFDMTFHVLIFYAIDES